MIQHAPEKRPVRIGSGREALAVPMTHEQALRYGNAQMPLDLRRAGFKTDVFASDESIHGGLWYRVSYCLSVPQSRS